MAKIYDVKYVLVCDDVRQEVSKKAIIIGLYPNNEIVVPSLPINTTSQTILVMIVPYKKKCGHLEFRIKDPKGEELLRMEGDPEFDEVNKLTPLIFPRSPAAFANEGTHEIILSMGSEKPKKIGEFKIIKGSAASS